MKKARHYLTALSRINEEKVRGTIHVKRIDSNDNVSDLFTKALGGALHIRHSTRANGYDMNFLSGSSYHSRDTSIKAKSRTVAPKPTVTDIAPSNLDSGMSCSMIYTVIGRLAETGEC